MNIGTSVVVLGTAAFPERVAGHIGTVTDEEETHVRMIGPGRMVKVRIDDEIDMGFGDVYPAGYVVMGFSVDELTDMTSTAPHPDPNDPHVGECNRCHRKTWDAETIGTEDRMTQPDGGPCGGTFEEKR